jgi:enamine deaminase RidA (YjgF/YER057c/UK114 family)
MSSPDPRFVSPATMPPTFGYSQVVSAPAARIVWTAGQVAMDAEGVPQAIGDLEGQTRLAMENVGRALEAADAGWADVIKLTFYVVAVDELPIVRAVRDEFLNVSRPPTSTLVQVAGLFMPEFLIEIEAVACP